MLCAILAEQISERERGKGHELGETRGRGVGGGEGDDGTGFEIPGEAGAAVRVSPASSLFSAALPEAEFSAFSLSGRQRS